MSSRRSPPEIPCRSGRINSWSSVSPVFRLAHCCSSWHSSFRQWLLYGERDEINIVSTYESCDVWVILCDAYMSNKDLRRTTRVSFPMGYQSWGKARQKFSTPSRCPLSWLREAHFACFTWRSSFYHSREYLSTVIVSTSTKEPSSDCTYIYLDKNLVSSFIWQTCRRCKYSLLDFLSCHC